MCGRVVAAAALHDIAEGSVRRWEQSDLLAYRNACWRQLSSWRGVVCTAEGAARLGHPAKETIHYTMQHNGEGLAVWLPPQAASGGGVR